MQTTRHVVDYALKRHRALEAAQHPHSRAREAVCDADPLLVRSAYHHGEPLPDPCPLCDHQPLLKLRYVFGAQLGQYSGRLKTPAELVEMETEFGEFMVREVEVCTECGWNFMTLSYVLGDGITRRPPRRQKTVEDIYG